jgi:hypothetical protein
MASCTRFILCILLLLAAGLAAAPVAAQTEATRLASLAVELWPDYDRPAMLVLLTGTLPADVPLPATVAIPLPAAADVNAVARYDALGGLFSDVDYTATDGQLTLTTPTDRFRVEYYVPYTVNGGEHAYTFDWTADLNIDEVTVVVQQPVAATEFNVTPAPDGTAAGRGDDLIYHTLPARSVGAGEPFTVGVVYSVEAPVLSAPSQSLPVDAAATAAPTSPTTTDERVDPLWLLAGAAALALIGGAWYMGRRHGQTTARARKPQPARPVKRAGSKSPAARPNQPTARYCHNCGQPAQSEDTFCRNCGVQLKQK